jgi:hypothetical protein
MGLAMNRFLLMPKPKPEFKMVQPLPPFFNMPTAGRGSASAPEVTAPDLESGRFPKILLSVKTEFGAATRNMTS